MGCAGGFDQGDDYAFLVGGQFSAIGVLEDDLAGGETHVLGEKPCGLVFFLGALDELDLKIGGGLVRLGDDREGHVGADLHLLDVLHEDHGRLVGLIAALEGLAIHLDDDVAGFHAGLVRGRAFDDVADLYRGLTGQAVIVGDFLLESRHLRYAQPGELERLAGDGRVLQAEGEFLGREKHSRRSVDALHLVLRVGVVQRDELARLHRHPADCLAAGVEDGRADACQAGGRHQHVAVLAAEVGRDQRRREIRLVRSGLPEHADG